MTFYLVAKGILFSKGGESFSFLNILLSQMSSVVFKKNFFSLKRKNLGLYEKRVNVRRNKFWLKKTIFISIISLNEFFSEISVSSQKGAFNSFDNAVVRTLWAHSLRWWNAQNWNAPIEVLSQFIPLVIGRARPVLFSQEPLTFMEH